MIYQILHIFFTALLLQGTTTGQEFYFPDNITGEKRADSLNSLSKLNISESPGKAYFFASQAAKYSDSIDYDKGIAFAAFHTGEYFYRVNAYDSALVYYNKALPYFENEATSNDLCEILLAIGKSHDSLSEFAKAKEFYSRVVKIAIDNDLDKYHGIAILNLGNIERIEGFYDSAFDKNLRAYDLFLKTGYKRGMAESLRNTGFHYQNAGEYDKAINYLNEALNTFNSIDDWQGTASVYGHIGLIKSVTGELDSALIYHEKALKIRDEYKDLNGIAISLTNIADVHNKKGEHKQALGYLNRAIDLRKQTDNPFGYNVCLVLKANIYRHLGIYDTVTVSLKKALAYAEKANSKPLLRMVYESYYNFYLEQENYEEALRHFQLFETYKDSLSYAELSNQINNIRLKYETDKQIEQINLLNKQKNFEARIIAILSILVVLVFFIAVRLYNKNKLYNKAINTIKDQNSQFEILNEKLSEKNKSLVELNQTRDKFFSIVAHDLRNPFVTIFGYTEMLINDDSLSEEEKTFMVEQIDKSSRRAFALLENLLQWGMSQTGAIQMKKEEVSVKLLLLEALSHVKPQADKKEILLKLSSGEDIKVFADQTMIVTVFRNLLSNAIKFTPNGGDVKIEYFSEGKYAVINFADSGIGIPENELTKIFTSAKIKDGTSNEKGSGLGLMVCREFVEKNDGKISVTSNYGKGSVFTVKLPEFNQNN